MDLQSADVRATPTNTAAHAAADAPMLARADQASRNTPQLDSQLIVQIGQHDEQALGTLYDRYGALVYTIALRITQDRARAETIVEAVSHSVWQSARSFQIGASVPVWLIRMTRQQAMDVAHPQDSHTRTRLAAHPETRTIRPDEQGADGVEDSHTRTRLAAHPETRTIRPDEQGADGVEALNMRRVLDTLPIDLRDSLELAYYDGLTCRDIATRLREPVSTIKARLRVGLCMLSEALRNAEAHLDE